MRTFVPTQSKIIFLIILLTTGLFSCGKGNGTVDLTTSDQEIYSVVLGGVTAREAKINISSKAGGNISIKYRSGTDEYVKKKSSLSNEIDGIKFEQFFLNNLQNETCYDYYFEDNNSIIISFPTHSFCTFPQNPEHLKIGILADLNLRNNAPAPMIQALAESNPDIVFLVGDWDHRDPNSLNDLINMHSENLGQSKLAAIEFNEYFSGKVPVDYIWDDHDFGQNNSNRHSPIRNDAIKTYDLFWPTYQKPNPDKGLWHSFRFGDLAEVFVLDLRSQRDFDTFQDPRFISDNLPTSNREILRWDPERSMLDGEEFPENRPSGQKEWFKYSLLHSTAKWKVIVSTVTWNSTTEKDDSWWDFMYERDELLNFIETNNIQGVMIVSGDIHSGGGIDNGENGDLPEMSVPSVNLNTDKGRGTCNIHPSTEIIQRSSCGEWSEGFFESGSGHGLLTLTKSEAILETKNTFGGQNILVLH